MKSVECKCGCGKFFNPDTPSQVYWSPWHDPDNVVKFQLRATKYARMKRWKAEDVEDFTSFAVSEYIKRGYTNCANLGVDWLRSNNATDYRAWRKYKDTPPQLISIDECHGLSSVPLPDSTDESTDLVVSIMDELPERTREMVELYRGGLTKKKIALLFDVSESRVSQLFSRLRIYAAKAIAKRAHATAQTLKPIDTELEIEWVEIA